MEEELLDWGNSLQQEEEPEEEVKCSNLRASISMMFDVFVYYMPKVQVKEDIED